MKKLLIVLAVLTLASCETREKMARVRRFETGSVYIREVDKLYQVGDTIVLESPSGMTSSRYTILSFETNK